MQLSPIGAMVRQTFPFVSARRTGAATLVRGALIAMMVVVFGITNAPDPAAAQSGFPNPGDRLMVNTDALNLRDDQGLDSDVIDVLPYGTGLTFVSLPASGSDDGRDWYQVRTDDGETGWVAGDYISFGATPGSIQIDDLVMVDTDALNIRDGAGLDANVIDQLTYGFTASVIDGPISTDGYTWYKISTSAITGWVAGENLVVDQASSS
jgi:uncharacterized protein YgiM (DUF1202 family)